jgi:outer membrane protein OmpA-like peptidoglycan-associated protein
MVPGKIFLKKIEGTELSTKTLKNKEVAHQVSNRSGLLMESNSSEQVLPKKQIPPILPGIETDKTSLSNDAEKFALNQPDNDKYESIPTQSVMPLPEEKNTIYFEHNSNGISEQAYKRLDQIFQIISKYPNSELNIEGYTDSSGNFAYNRNLSALRADKVRFYFISRGIDPSRINTLGLGAQNFIATNDTAAGRRLNRRVEIKIHTKLN